MEYRRKKFSIILFSLLFHLFVLVLLLIFYASPEHDWMYFDTTPTSINTPETIFSELPSSLHEQQDSMPTIEPHDETWAELRPRAGTLGDSMDPSRHADGVTQDESKDTLGVAFQESSTSNGDGDDDEQLTQKDPSICITDATQGERDFPFVVSANEMSVSNHLEQSKPSQKTQKVSAKKRQAQKALAHITRGYLEQLAHEGENLIKTIGGDPNKMPSAEQLKYERYLAKIQWCLQNAHNINRDKCQMHEPIQTTMRVYFTLTREGKMADLKIIQSSGDAFVDRYIRSLFETASSSFPPVPTYIKEDPYPLLYTVMVCWNVSNPSSFMGLMRE